MDDLYPFAFGTAIFNQIEDDINKSPLGWQYSECTVYCSPFDVARVVYFMFTKLVRIPAFDRTMAEAILRSGRQDFVFEVDACVRMLCENLREVAPHGSRASQLESDMKTWVYSKSRVAIV